MACTYYVLAFTLLGISLASPTWRDCGSKLGKIEAVSITGCKNIASGQACPLKKNANSTIMINFTTTAQGPPITQLTSVVHGIVAQVPIPFPVDNPNACKSCGLPCPLKPNATYSFHTSLFVKSSYPKIKLAVEWELQDKSGKDVVCMVVLAEVED